MRTLHFAATAAVLVLTSAVSTLADFRGSQTLAAPLASLPLAIGGWSASREIPLDPQTAERLNASSYLSREYVKAGQALGLFVAYYTHQSSTGYMHSPKICLPSSGWEIQQPGYVRVPTPTGETEINRYVISNGDKKALILYWYQSSDRIIADEYMTKLYMIHDSVLYGRGAGSIIRIQLPLDAEAEADGIRFASNVMQDLKRIYGR
jgi:EpsI family protein